MFDFDRMADKYLHKELKPKTCGRYYPSEVGYCLRKTWYSYNHPLETDKHLIKVFEIGNMVHDFVVRVLQSEKNEEVELIGAEIPFVFDNDGYTVSGRIDDLVLVKLNGIKVLVEVKSTSYLGINEPSEQHVMQLQLYMHNTGIHHGIVLYVEKNSLKSKAFPVAYNKDMADKILRRFSYLHSSLTCNSLPFAEAKIEPKMNWMCKSCPYLDKCEKEEK